MSDSITRLNAALEGRYRIEGELGEGGMATVYLADDIKHERKVALKVLKPELAAVVGAERFLAEIKTTANLQHPHILALHDSGQADGFLFFVMPYIEGETLRDRLRRESQLPVDEAVRIARAIAGALAVAHEQGVVHRDIKPANILLSRGEPVVADFGISLAMEAEGRRLTQTGLTVGTPYYMSPEQATGDQSVDAPTDVYSLACVLYEMLVGEPPYLGNTAQAVLGKILQGRPVSAAAIRRSIPANVDAAIRKALERLPADRFTNAKDFARALADPGFRHGAGSASAVSAGPWRRLSIGLAALAVVTTTFAVLALTRPDAPTPVIRYVLAFEGEAATGSTGAFGTSVALSEDGSNLVYVGDFGEADFQLFSRGRHGLEATAIPGTEGGYQPFFSPDGRHVGFIEQATRELKVVSLGGEPPVTLADSGIYRLGAAWGKDGYVYFSQMPEGGIARIPATGGEVEPISTPDASQGSFLRHSWPDVLPNGKGVLVTIQRAVNALGQDDDVAVVDVETGEVKVLFRGILGRYSTTGHVVFVTHEGELAAAPFDQDRLAVTGPSVPLQAGVPVIRGPDVALSQSGRLVYSTVGTTAVQEVVWVDRSGGATPFEPGWTVEPARESGPSLSPDGRSVAVAVRSSGGEPEVWVKQLGGPLSRLVHEGTMSRPRWSLDGRSIMYVTNVGGAPDLFAQRADGSSGAELVLDLEAPVYDGVWSRDGEWLVVRTGPETTSPTNDILGLRLGSDAAPIPLVTTDFQETSPALSPDGRFLAYVSNESGRTEVYVRPFPNVNDARATVSTDGGREPLWAYNGRELFYKNASRELVAATLANGAALEVVERTTLFQLPPGASYYHARANYDISSDDQRFLMLRSAAEEARTRSDYIVVENFHEELKARLPN